MTVVVVGLLTIVVGGCGGAPVTPSVTPTAASQNPVTAGVTPGSGVASGVTPGVTPGGGATNGVTAGVTPTSVAAGTGAAAAATAPGSGPQTVHVGLGNASASNAGIYVADGLGFFREQGIALDYVDFGSASEVMPALARGSLDIGDVGINPAFFNAAARQVSVKLVADKGSQPPGFGFTSLMVATSKADAIKGPADLKGRKIAMTPPGLGTANGYVLSKYLTQASLTPDDVNIQPIAFPEQIAALANNSVDAAIMAEPFATRALQTGIAVRLATLDQIDPNQQVAGLVYADKFIAEQRELGVKWMIGYLKGIRAYNAAVTKGVDRDKVFSILATKTDIKDPQLWGQIVPAGLNPDGKLNLQSIRDAETFFVKIGLVQQAAEIDTVVDQSFTDAAVKALGPAS